MSQTTTNRGRGLVATPDLGYDTLDGGTALFGVVNVLFTYFADHLHHRYFTYTLANGATQTITHNLGLALSALKNQIIESAALRTDAQVAADYTFAAVDTASFTITNASGGSKTFKIIVRGSKLGINSADFDAACSLTTTGTLTAAGIQQSGDTGYIFNSGTTNTGANRQATLVRDTTNMSAAAVITLPKATSTIATLGLAETLTLKTLTACASITLAASGAIDWAAGNVAVGASIGANTLTLGGSTSTVRAAGTLSCLALVTDSNDLVLNNAATESSASWKGTLRRPSSGMTADAVYTLPVATTTLLGTDQAQVVTLKDIDGGTASNTSRLTIARDTLANITSLTRKAATIWYATDTAEKRLYADDGTQIRPVTGPVVTGTTAAPTALVAGTALAPAAGAWQEVNFIKGSGGAVTVTANPQIAAGTKIGQRLTLIGGDDTNTVTYANGNGLDLNGGIVLDTKAVLGLVWDGTNWRELFARRP